MSDAPVRKLMLPNRKYLGLTPSIKLSDTCLQTQTPYLSSGDGYSANNRRGMTLPETKARRARSEGSSTRSAAAQPAPKPPAKPTLGMLVRSLRSRNGWTLKEMSDRTGIPFSTLSKVEHDRLTLTYDKLQQLGERLGLRMSELFAEPETAEIAPAITARRSIGSVENAIRVNTQNYDYFYLCTELRRKRMVPIVTHVRAKSLDEFGQLVRHSGEEWTYVVKGRIEVHTEFYDKVCLEEGQSIYIDSSMGHAYIAGEGCQDALVIGVCSSSAEDQLHELLSAHTPDPPPARARRGRKPRAQTEAP